MRVALTEETMTVGEAPIGLLRLEDPRGTLIVKTEYGNDDGSRLCYIVSSGETYCGDGDKALCRALVLIPSE